MTRCLHECLVDGRGCNHHVTVGERLRVTEVVALRADPSAPALMERVVRLEERVWKGVRVTDDTENDSDRLGMGKVSTGNSYSLDSEDRGDGIEEKDRAGAETLFENPRVSLAVLPIDIDESHTDGGVESISGSSESFPRTVRTFNGGENGIKEVGSRPFFLGSIHRKELRFRECGGYEQWHHWGGNAQCQLVGPALRFYGKPTETMNPLVVTTVADIATIARRLGMSWEVFDPEGYTMRAQGNGYGIFSTPGWPNCLVLQYKPISVDDSSFTDLELYVPNREAGMMGFGRLPGCRSLSIPTFKLGTAEEVYTTMDMLDRSGKASSKLKDMNSLLVGKWDAHCMYGFSDLIALAAPMIRYRHGTIIRVPMPAEYCSSLLSQKECFVVFHNRLKEVFCKARG